MLLQRSLCNYSSKIRIYYFLFQPSRSTWVANLSKYTNE